MREARRDYAIGYQLAVLTTVSLLAAIWAAKTGHWLVFLIVALAGSFAWLLVVYLLCLTIGAAAASLYASRPLPLSDERARALRREYLDGHIDGATFETRLSETQEARRGA